ncbi:MAG: type I-C CRISPR-associated endonuclease Cas1 [Gammaproteobacteria bacterium]|nr:type I-C CRISPR-associated endonuclease Cas1 [Gammaproteobacteria bacterium]
MKKLLNTVYVTSSEAALRKDGENLVVDIEGKERVRVPLHMVNGVVAFGPVLLTPGLIMACTAGAITITLCDRNGRFQGRVEGPVSGNVLLRKAQYAAADEKTACTNIVRALLIGKVSNQRQVLARARRDYRSGYADAAAKEMDRTLLRLAKVIQKLLVLDDIDVMRGLEGDAARMYFATFPHLIRTTDSAMSWSGRTRRPPLDPLNALLSFLYTLLTHDCRSGAESVGLDPAVGFLHRIRPGRPSLALDLMEELRPILADRLALSLVNRKQVTIDDFEVRDNGAVLLKDDARKTVLTAWQERKRDERLHPFLNESTPLGLVPFLQAQMLARHLRGDLDTYPPWLWR